MPTNLTALLTQSVVGESDAPQRAWKVVADMCGNLADAVCVATFGREDPRWEAAEKAGTLYVVFAARHAEFVMNVVIPSAGFPITIDCNDAPFATVANESELDAAFARLCAPDSPLVAALRKSGLVPSSPRPVVAPKASLPVQREDVPIIRAGAYRHFKGGMYDVLCCVHDSTNGETHGRMMVLYRSRVTGVEHVREYDQFVELVDNGVARVARFHRES